MISVDEYKKMTQETGEDYPLLTLEEFFVDNNDEYSIAPNQAEEGRPSLDEIYAKFKSLESKDVKRVSNWIPRILPLARRAPCCLMMVKNWHFTEIQYVFAHALVKKMLKLLSITIGCNLAER